MKVIYEDNHIIAIGKESGEIAQGDKTGDPCLLDTIKEWLREKYGKPGNVFLGLPHRLDRPTSGIMLLAKTGKALSRLNLMFAQNEISKTYLAITDGRLQHDRGELSDFIVKNEAENKSHIVREMKNGAKPARLAYRLLAEGDRYFLHEVELLTGRHHQIRAQFASRGIHIKGDLKYGAKRPNEDGSISLHSYRLRFTHPVRGEVVTLVCPPEGKLWEALLAIAEANGKEI